MSSEVLEVAVQTPVAVLTLNRPGKKNALNTDLRNAITAALTEIEADDSISVVVITGAGSAFCAGFDLAEFQESSMQEVLGSESAARYHERLRTFSKPLVAAVNGPALAGGFDIAAHCDVRIASEHASFGHPEIKFGSGVMYAALAAIIGAGTASDLALSGRRIHADEAFRMGLVSRVVAPDEVLSQALATAHTIAEAPLHGLIQVKRAIIAHRGA